MILYKDSKMVEMRDDMPEENWTNSDVYVVPDGSALAEKVLECAPYYDFVLDEAGELVDITPTERPAPEPAPPTAEEMMLELDYRMSLLELGVSENDVLSV